MKKQPLLAIGVGIMAITSIAMAALPNENRMITQLETTQARLLIHVSTNHAAGAPSGCSANTQIMACDLAESYCDLAGRLAIAAHMAGREIDYEISTTECLSTTPKLIRFRISQ